MTNETTQNEYRVLARKYRPQNFDELIGQDALVTTLKNAIESNRIAHAFMLTGIRGTGKTTTARIIAKALNYTGADGKAGPTTGDTSDCSICQAITEDRHPDVMEMDAASRTGIDDIREILDGVRYAPVSARYKIYIIDEVHMLSKQAFNALLKTLEEPPSNVKFIFATTEIRKVPVTILSRCQRFDLKRVEVETLRDHFARICDKEQVKAEDEALTLIAQAADGSVRDGLSLLDQAIALGAADEVKTDDVIAMLGATDRLKILELIEVSLKGEPQQALEICRDLHRMGTEPRMVLQDMMDMIHGLSVLAIDEKAVIDALPHAGLDQAKAMAGRLTVPQLQKSWQILLKGLGELHHAPNPQKAAEMVILRLIYAADLPDPADLLKKIKAGQGAAAGQAAGISSAPQDQGGSHPQLRAIAGGGGAVMAHPAPQDQENAQPSASPDTLEGIITLFENRGEMRLAAHLYNDIACFAVKKGRLEFKAYDSAPSDLAGRVRSCLTDWTGDTWMISVVQDAGEAISLADSKQLQQNEARNKILSHPNVKAVLEVFPDAEII